MKENYSCLPMSFAEDNSELVKYTVDTLPIRSVMSHQSDYPQLSVVNHWHRDFEFSLVTKGHMLYSVNGERIELYEGDMIFVNSARMHYGFWEKREECEFLCVILGMSLFSAIPEKLMEQLIGENAHPYIRFSRTIVANRKIIERVQLLHKICQAKEPGFEIVAVGLCCEICSYVFESCNGTEYYSGRDKGNLMAVHDMVGYIQRHFSEKITLNSIANAGSVCRSHCCVLFREYIGKTPIDYLNEYRISQAIELLKGREWNITEVAAKCGFNSASYFAEVFHKNIGCSPKQFIQCMDKKNIIFLQENSENIVQKS